MDRTTIAYLLILLLAVVAAGLVAYRAWNSHERVNRRRHRREKLAYEGIMADKNDRADKLD